MLLATKKSRKAPAKTPVERALPEIETENKERVELYWWLHGMWKSCNDEFAGARLPAETAAKCRELFDGDIMDQPDTAPVEVLWQLHAAFMALPEEFRRRSSRGWLWRTTPATLRNALEEFHTDTSVHDVVTIRTDHDLDGSRKPTAMRHTVIAGAPKVELTVAVGTTRAETMAALVELLDFVRDQWRDVTQAKPWEDGAFALV